MSHGNKNAQSLLQLAQQNYSIYEELKNREMDYINLIKDLHEENYRLRMLLTNQMNKEIKLNSLNADHNKTPSFNSMNNSKVVQPQQQGKGGKKNFENCEKFSFGDRANCLQKFLINNHKSLVQKSEKEKEKTYFVDIASQYYRGQQYKNQSSTFQKKSNFILAKSSPTNQEFSFKNIQKIQQISNVQTPQITRKINKSKLWGITTNLSINKDSNISQIRGNGHICDDTISEHSQIDNFHHKFNPNKQYLENLTGDYDHKRHKENAQNAYISTNQDSQPLRTISNRQEYQRNQNMRRSQQQLSSTSSPRHKYEGSASSLQSFQASSPRNCLKINNKVYL